MYLNLILALIILFNCRTFVFASEADPAKAASKSAPKVYRQAVPGYRFSFPADHASHDEFKTEWWYYTGHLKSKEGRQFGYELTFFRSGQNGPKYIKTGPWAVNNLYLAHFAVSDLQSAKFFFAEKLNRKGLGSADARSDTYAVHNEDWSAQLRDGRHFIKAKSGAYSLELELKPIKAPAVHGKDGASQKASCYGCASHYYSLTRLVTKGRLRVGQDTFPVEGTSWMDHEFGSNQLTDAQVGWDWFSIQLDNQREIMLYVMRLKDGTIDPNSAGSIIAESSGVRHLAKKDFQIEVKDFWVSPLTKARYPSGWKIKIPAESLELKVQPLLKNQELTTGGSTGVNYWEGACSVEGQEKGRPVRGSAYVELTGYAGAFAKKI